MAVSIGKELHSTSVAYTYCINLLKRLRCVFQKTTIMTSMCTLTSSLRYVVGSSPDFMTVKPLPKT
jgi:hypothetical protein